MQIRKLIGWRRGEEYSLVAKINEIINWINTKECDCPCHSPKRDLMCYSSLYNCRCDCKSSCDCHCHIKMHSYIRMGCPNFALSIKCDCCKPFIATSSTKVEFKESVRRNPFFEEVVKNKAMESNFLPETHELYWAITSYGDVEEDKWVGTKSDWYRYYTGRVFSTKLQAELWLDRYGKYLFQE